MLETHENIESIAAEAADGVAATSAARWEQLRCATRELLRLTRQRDNVRSFSGTCALSVRSARLRSSDCGTHQGVDCATITRLSVCAGLRAHAGAGTSEIAHCHASKVLSRFCLFQACNQPYTAMEYE